MENSIHIIYNTCTQNFEITEKDLKLIAGNDVNLLLHFKNEDGVSIDITDFIIFFTVKSDPTLSDEETTPESEITIDVDEHDYPLEGKTKIEITNERTKDLIGSYFYSIKIITNENKIYTIVQGLICFKKDITNRE